MSVNIKFENLKYAVKEKKTGSKSILQSVSGSFSSGKLTGILGTSGAGKTTLLNILSGYLASNVTGKVYVDGHQKTSNELRKISTYLSQDILIQPFLTVKESLTIAANLKLGRNDELKNATIKYVAITLGLTNCMDTLSDHLSGGQRKRLSVALELISDPSVIFLDEPTTGLDEVAMKMCIEWLRTLALEGKTVICTIHQPSNSTLKLFDYLYFMDNGHCIYNGTVSELVPFLSSVNFYCPTNYNPADYILEISQYSSENRRLLTDNTNLIIYDEDNVSTLNSSNIKEEITRLKNLNQFRNSTPFWKQVNILLQRSFLQLIRNRLNIFFQCFHFTMCGLVIGGTFYNFGQDAKHLFHNFMFCVIVIVYLIFSTSIAPALTYPFEYKLFRNEIANRWYDINAYYTAFTIISLPIPIIMGVCFTALTYTMSNQPREMDRFMQFCIVVIITVVISAFHGKAVGMCCSASAMYGSVLAPGTLVPPVALSFYGFGYAQELNYFVKMIMQFSFVRYSLVGLMTALYNNRDKIECSDIYCHYNDPHVFLKDMGMLGNYRVQITALIIFLILYKCFVYTLLRYKLNHDLRA